MRILNSVDSNATLGMLAWMMMTGLGTLQVQPVLGGALVDRMGIGLAGMGQLFGIELIATAIGCGLSAIVMSRVKRRRFLLLLIALLALANIGSAMVGGFVALCSCRALAGFAGGGMQAIVFATTALRARKEQTFAVINIVLLIWGALTMGVAPIVLQRLGVDAVYTSFALMAIIALVGLKHIPASSGAANLGDAKQSGLEFNGRLFSLLGVFALLFGAHGALWVYQERIGRVIGMSPQVIGLVLGGSILAGAVGAALAGVINRHLGYKGSQLTAFGGAILASLMVVYGEGAVAYSFAALILMAAWFFGLTYLQTLTAELDASGRLTGMANAATYVGQGCAPIAAAAVVGDGNFRAVGWLCVGIYLACVALVMYATSSDIRQTRSAAPSK